MYRYDVSYTNYEPLYCFFVCFFYHKSPSVNFLWFQQKIPLFFESDTIKNLMLLIGNALNMVHHQGSIIIKTQGYSNTEHSYLESCSEWKCKTFTSTSYRCNALFFCFCAIAIWKINHYTVVGDSVLASSGHFD